MNPLLDLARRGWLLPMTRLGQLGKAHYRVVFRGAGLRSGFLAEVMSSPGTADELCRRLGVQPDLAPGLAAWLDAGVACGDLSLRDGRYAVRSSSLRRLLRPSNNPVAAFTEEMAGLHTRLLFETPERLRTGQRFTLADADPDLIARSSRLGEPWITSALEGFVPAEGAVRLLEVGCGSGAHIRTAARLNPQLTAVGVELQEPAAEQARRNLAEWGLDQRVEVRSGDIRDLTPDGSFDLLTLHQNIYYFPEAQQAELLAHLARFVKPGGALLVTSIVRGSGIGSTMLDLWGAMTEGASRMPVPDELLARMRQAGLTEVRFEKPGGDGFYGAFVGVRP